MTDKANKTYRTYTTYPARLSGGACRFAGGASRLGRLAHASMFFVAAGRERQGANRTDKANKANTPYAPHTPYMPYSAGWAAITDSELKPR